ncbi:unknown [Cryptophlebia leucotreta granulovirus]|uniref:Uncharacterized protein n=1 Tax=Cryptophlebia leucotreta granulosis virus TaxID=35254 RepID=Q7T5T2_GVCL|nr:hypothetical protein [Cryptophlebia leucotreta granulovirus]AAQ21602.1 unknown [Cryptophlebia leucotreta granulovirus]
MLSIFFDESTVYYNFDDILYKMIECGFEQVDKKILTCDRLKVKCCNDQVFYTNGVDIDLRLLKCDECYVSFEGILDLLESNIFGEKDKFEMMLVNCTLRVVLNHNHNWLELYKSKLRTRISASFNFYFKVLEQYMLANQPNVEVIGDVVKKFVCLAEHHKHFDDIVSLSEAYHAYDKASAIILQNMKM